jgi:hypothetical protein
MSAQTNLRPAITSAVTSDVVNFGTFTLVVAFRALESGVCNVVTVMITGGSMRDTHEEKQIWLSCG